MLRAGLWSRVSTEEQAKFGYSIETQKDDLESYCKKNNIKIVDHYSDEGISAGKPWKKRPEMVRLIEDVEAGKIDIIIFTRLDRWFRNVSEYFKVQEILDDNRVNWKAIYEDYDTTTANGRMSITIFLAIAQNEREKTAERIKVVLDNKRKKGEACFGGNKVVGYKKVKDSDGIVRLVKDEDERAMVEDFWDTLITSMNMHLTIRKMMNVYGISKDWKTWKRMSENEFYCGHYKGNEHFCEPYVSVEDFKRFQESRPAKKTPTGRVYIFSGLMKCPECGRSLYGDAKVREGKTWKIYRCSYRCRGCSNQSTISEIKTEKQLLDRLNDLLGEAIASAEIESKKPKPKPQNDVKKLKEKLRRLDIIYMNGNIEDDEYLNRQSELKAQIVKAESEKPASPADIENLKKILNTDFMSIYGTFTDEEKQRFWKGLIKEIRFEGKTLKEVIFF